jgi:hypothetical protein
VLVQEELAKQQVTVLLHPPYTPDLASRDFFLSLFKRKVTRLFISVS